MGKLVRLELNNFKSYKGHHVLLFGNASFTSIIGPNGSGKSNSMDAISFVLGIKSSHLRSTHLRDLIYRGRILKTSKVHADGSAAAPGQKDISQAVNGQTDGDGADDGELSTQRDDAQTASVVAIYEDDAGEEQHWKRTITTAGQSEYRINNRIVNAKQYNEVLEAENILIKARNFLVFQGDVEAIASQSPKDLTRLVEQISGSLEHKAEYDRLQAEAEKANEDQQYKQTQRRGINTEIKTFGEQKKEADGYNRKADERDQAVVTHVLWKLYHFQRNIEESGAEIQRHQDELKEYRRNIEQFEKQLDEAKQEQAKSTKEVQKSERSIKANEKQIEDKTHDLVPIDAKIAASDQTLQKYQKRMNDVTKEKDSQSQGVEQLKKDLSIVSKAQSKWEGEFSMLTKKQGKQLNEADLQEYNRLRAEVNRRAASAQLKVDHLTRQRKTDEDTVTSLKSSVNTAKAQRQRLESELAETKERRKEFEDATKKATAGIEAKKKEINKVTSERLRAAQKRTETEEKLQQVLNRLIEADDGRKQTAKEAKSKETVSSMKRIFPGVRGRVHELCKPKQKKYHIAVSSALGRQADSIVVDTEKTSRDCISYLREQRLGEATFIPLDTIQVKRAASNLKGLHKNMRLAIDTIEYDHVVERAMSYACGNAMICDDLDTAKHLCYDKNIEAKAVTLDGTIIHKGGLMTGGRGPNDRNDRKWDDTEVANLTKVKDDLIAELTGLPRGHEAATDAESLRGELVGIEQQLAFARSELKALEKNEDSKKKELNFAQGQLREFQPKHEEQSSALEALRSKISDSQSEIAQVEDELYADFCQRLKFDSIRDYEAQQGSLQQESAQKKLDFTKQKSKLENQLAFENTRLQTTNDRLKGLQGQAKRDEELIASLAEEREAMQNELEGLQEQSMSIKDSLKALKSTQDKKAEKVAERRREVQNRSKKVDFVIKELSKHENEVQREASQRYALLRKCKIEELKIPLVEGSATFDSLPVDDLLQGIERDNDRMDVDGEDPDESVLQPAAIQDYGIEIDFDELDDDLKEVSNTKLMLYIGADPVQDNSEDQDKSLSAVVASLAAELSSLNPNMRAIERLSSAQDKLKSSDADYRAAQRQARDTTEAFEEVKQRRADLFNKAFSHISEQIKPVYQGLTRSSQYPLGGQAYLDTMAHDDDTPFLGGLKYHAMPPLKRFRDMDALSGGEKTIAALALLFAIHSYAPSPFFVLDEVDAALDNANVAKVANYIKEHAKPGMQFIVISLKTSLFQESDCLVGVLRDQGANTSRAVTLDLRKYQPT